MWVYIANPSYGDGVISDNNFSPITWGQLFYRDESDPNKFWTYNWENGLWTYKTANNETSTWALTQYYVPRYGGWYYLSLRRLDVFNCETYGMCATSPGSRYDIRRNIGIYNYYGKYMGYISPPKQPVFNVGYGYTKATNISQITGTGVGIRVAGYRNADGSYYMYQSNPNDKSTWYYAAEDFTKPPSNYIINTF